MRQRQLSARSRGHVTRHIQWRKRSDHVGDEFCRSEIDDGSFNTFRERKHVVGGLTSKCEGTIIPSSTVKSKFIVAVHQATVSLPSELEEDEHDVDPNLSEISAQLGEDRVPSALTIEDDSIKEVIQHSATVGSDLPRILAASTASAPAPRESNDDSKRSNSGGVDEDLKAGNSRQGLRWLDQQTNPKGSVEICVDGLVLETDSVIGGNGAEDNSGSNTRHSEQPQPVLRPSQYGGIVLSSGDMPIDEEESLFEAASVDDSSVGNSVFTNESTPDDCVYDVDDSFVSFNEDLMTAIDTGVACADDFFERLSELGLVFANPSACCETEAYSAISPLRAATPPPPVLNEPSRGIGVSKGEDKSRKPSRKPLRSIKTNIDSVTSTEADQAMTLVPIKHRTDRSGDKQVRFHLSGEKLKICACCGKDGKGTPGGLMLCSGCFSCYYCNAACQSTDWANGHKENCGPCESRRI